MEMTDFFLDDEDPGHIRDIDVLNFIDIVNQMRLCASTSHRSCSDAANEPYTFGTWINSAAIPSD